MRKLYLDHIDYVAIYTCGCITGVAGWERGLHLASCKDENFVRKRRCGLQNVMVEIYHGCLNQLMKTLKHASSLNFKFLNYNFLN